MLFDLVIMIATNFFTTHKSVVIACNVVIKAFWLLLPFIREQEPVCAYTYVSCSNSIVVV